MTGSDGTDEDYIDVLNDNAAPKEPNCKPLPFEIPPGVLEEPEADFFCGTEPELNEAGTYLEIVAPNTCILICDFHLRMNLDCRISVNGETECYEEGDPSPVLAENIHCWVSPIPARPTEP